jgi:hypothetical protein
MRGRQRQISVGAWHGQYGPGAMREHRRAKRKAAEERNARTKPENRRQHRLAKASQDAAAARQRNEKRNAKLARRTARTAKRGGKL